MRKCSTSSIMVYKPSSCDETQIPERYRWRVLYMFSYVLNRQVLNRRQDNKWGDYVCRKRENWQKVIGRDYFDETKSLALSIGLLQADNHYVVGKKSHGYRIGDSFVDDEFEMISLPAEKEVTKAAAKLIPDPPTEGIEGLLAEDVRRLSVDQVDDDLLAHLARNRKQKKVEHWEKEPMRMSPEMVSLIYREGMRRIREAEWLFKRDQYGRIHTSITCLKSELRNFLSIDGQRLIGVDINNSQALFLASILGNTKQSPLKEGKETERSERILDISNNIPLLNPSISPSTLIHNISLPLMNAVPIRCDIPPGYDEVRILTHLVSAGQFYEHFADAVGISRDDAKSQFMHFVFGSHKRELQLGKLFAKQFPSIYRMIRQVKQNAADLGHKKPHGVFATLLQRVEANFVIDTVCVRIKNEHPDIPIITIHDSILTIPKHVETLRATMEEEFGKLGVTAGLERVAYDQADSIRQMHPYSEIEQPAPKTTNGTSQTCA